MVFIFRERLPELFDVKGLKIDRNRSAKLRIVTNYPKFSMPILDEWQ
ncbi:MAG: hypothetical protein LBL39_00105 [Planctomycetaceae bacterium]|nr:hypothetical protein [Planctomycetaceae bacterium]